MAVSPYRKLGNFYPIVGLAAILVLITWLGLTSSPDDRATTWAKILVLMTAFAVIVGRGITGYWRGILIDSRNKMSLSRLQLLVWSLIVLSAIIAAVLSNVAVGWESPLEIDIPSQLWTLMGISMAAAVGSPAILGSVASKKVDTVKRDDVARRVKLENAINVDTNNESVVLKNVGPGDARWGDLLKGDEVGKSENVDMGKLQMFFFTFILAVGYAAAIGAIFDGGGPIVALPSVEEGMNVLLGISQTGYLATKAIPPAT